jgi:hypothetical protein
MGYYTNYKFTIDDSKSSDFDIGIFAEKFEEITDYRFDTNYLSLDGKWYECKEDMIKLSKLFPNVRFDLYGEGEENTDIWKAYFMNGEHEYVTAELILPEFEIDKIK